MLETFTPYVSNLLLPPPEAHLKSGNKIRDKHFDTCAVLSNFARFEKN